MHIRALALFVFASLTAVARGSAQAQGLQLPAPVGYVNDFAHVIPPDKAAAISAIIDDVRAKSGGEIVVVTLPDLSGRPIEEVATRDRPPVEGRPEGESRRPGAEHWRHPPRRAEGNERRRAAGTYAPKSDSAPKASSPTRRRANSATKRFRISGQRDYGDGIELMTLQHRAHFAQRIPLSGRPERSAADRSRAADAPAGGPAVEFHRSSGSSSFSSFCR